MSSIGPKKRLLRGSIVAITHRILVFSALLCVCASGCLSAAPAPVGRNTAGEAITEEGALPKHVAAWLKEGEQSEVTDQIKSIAVRIKGDTRRERLVRAMAYVWEAFSYDPWLKTEAFTRTAHQLYESRILCGCSDFALAQIVLFRALGIPSRMVLTCNVDWIHIYQHDGVSLPEGHSFIEVYLEDGWHLVDSTYRWMFSGYDPAALYYPHGQIFVRRGADFWAMGIRTISDLERVLRGMLSEYSGGFSEPGYFRHPL